LEEENRVDGQIKVYVPKEKIMTSGKKFREVKKKGAMKGEQSSQKTSQNKLGRTCYHRGKNYRLSQMKEKSGA